MLKAPIHSAIIVVLLGIIAWMFFHREYQYTEFHRLANRIDHALDIVQDLKELSQNIAIKDAIENFTLDGVPKDECCSPMGSDLFSAGAVLEIKSQHIFNILHEVLIELRRK